MDKIARESNIQDSIKVYLSAVLQEKSIPVSFDRSMKVPNLQESSINRWVSVVFGDFDYSSNNTTGLLLLNCCSRQDPEYRNVVRLSDYMRSCLVDPDQTDGMRRIPLIDVQHDNFQIGVILVTDTYARGQYDLEDQTKVKPLTVQLWAAARM